VISQVRVVGKNSMDNLYNLSVVKDSSTKSKHSEALGWLNLKLSKKKMNIAV
jgi:uncharacterized protein YycO